jgi:hypothetical protein
MRLEAKIDGLIQMQSLRHDALTSDIKHIRETQLATSSDHELRIRNLEAGKIDPARVAALEQRSVDPARLYSLEQKRYVEPKTVWTAVTVLTGIAMLALAIINLATR